MSSQSDSSRRDLRIYGLGSFIRHKDQKVKFFFALGQPLYYMTNLFIYLFWDITLTNI